MTTLTARLGGAVGDFGQAAWDPLVPGNNPFMRHGFLTALEDSGSVGEGTGWQPAPIVIEGPAATALFDTMVMAQRCRPVSSAKIKMTAQKKER